MSGIQRSIELLNQQIWTTFHGPKAVDWRRTRRRLPWSDTPTAKPKDLKTLENKIATIERRLTAYQRYLDEQTAVLTDNMFMVLAKVDDEGEDIMIRMRVSLDHMKKIMANII